MVTDSMGQSDDTTAFLRAARSGNLEKVIEYLDKSLDINTANSNGLNALHLASKDGHVEIVTELLKRGAKVDAATKKGNTALHIASLAGQSEIVNILIQYSAAVNIQSQNGFTPLYMAAQENHDQVVKLLLTNGANQSLATEDGFTPLAVAMQQGHDKVVSVLLENDSKGKVRLPALHIAAKKDDCKAADLLLQNDHKPDVTSKSGFTPLHIAAHYGNEEIGRLLIKKGADVNYLAKHNISPLHVAAKWGKNNMVKLLLENSATIDAKTRDGLTPLHCAARSGHEEVVSTLLEQSAPISARTKNGLAPLHMASQGDHVEAARVLLYHRAPVDEVTIDYLTSLHVAAHCGHVRVAKLLLDRKADPNARALNGFTPLHIACKKNRIKVVELLLKHGASIESTTESGLTPLHVASFMGCMNIVIFLLQHEANPDVPTVRGETPLHLAARANQTDIIRILLRNGAKVDARAREEQTPLHIASRLGNVDIVMLLLQHGAAVDTTTKDMYTALHIAAKEGQEEVAGILVENKASVTATTKNGFTPLHMAAKYGNMNVAKILLQKDSKLDAQGKNDITPLHLACHYDHPEVATMILEKGASPHLASQNGHTPLHIAARKNQMEIASALLDHGANSNAESKAGFTPLQLSAQKGHYDMTNLLIENGANTNHKSKNGLTSLHLCAQEDFIRVASILVKNGANVESKTETGYRPIHVAAHFGNLSMIKFLLKNNAQIDVGTNNNYTALHQAAQQGHANIATALLEGNAKHNIRTNDGLTPLNIAQKLGYISVMEVLKGLSYDEQTPDNKYWEEKYKVIAPESIQETSFMSDSDDEGGSDALINEQPYRYLTADLMKSLRDDSLPIDVTRDDPVHSTAVKKCEIKEFVQSNNYCLAENFDSTDTNGTNNVGRLNLRTFLVSFLVDARGGAMKGCRHSGIRIIIPPRRATMPIRVTCRLIKSNKIFNPPLLMEGEALATRIIEMGPAGATFLGPVLIDVPHFAAIEGKDREIIILRSDNGESWKEHDNTHENDDILFNSAPDLQMNSLYLGRITRIITTEFPQYFAIVTRIKQEVHVIGSDGGILISSVANHVQAVFPPGALTKKIKVGLQAHVIPGELTAKLLGNCVAVSPVITIEPRRRKFHKPITLTIPVPQAVNKGMINQYGGDTPTLRLLCSIAGGTSEAQWEDVTGSTPLTFLNDRVSFTTTVSARFWLMDCRNISEVPKMATELYKESLFVPFITNFIIYTKRMDILEATLRILCMTDGKETMHTLERQEEFLEIVKSRDVEALDGKDLYIEFSGNLVPVTKSGQQLKFTFKAFRQNRLSFHVKVRDPLLDPVARMMFMKDPKVAKGEAPQQPICVLNIVLPEEISSKTESDLRRKDAEPFAKNVACPLESVDGSYPNNLSTQGDISPELERQTYSEKRRFWEDITKKRESYQRSESEVSRASQLTVGESDSEYLQSIISEGENIEEMPERSETLEDLNIPDISECTVAEKAHYFEEQIQKELSASASKPLSKMTSQESFKEKRKSSIDASAIVEITEDIKTTKAESIVEKKDVKLPGMDDVKIEGEKKKEIQTTKVTSEIDSLIPMEASEVKTQKLSKPEIGEAAEGEKKDNLSEKKELEVSRIETSAIDYEKDRTICSEFIASESKFSQEEIQSASEIKALKEVSDSGVSSKQGAPSMIPVKTKPEQGSKFELKKDDKEITKEEKEIKKEVKEIKKEEKEVKKEVKEIKKEEKEVKKEVTQVKKDEKEIKKEIKKEVKKEVKEVKKEVKEIKKEVKKEEKVIKKEAKDMRPKEIPGLKREPSDSSKKDSKIPLSKREPSDTSDKSLSKKEIKVVDKPEPKKEIATKQESPSTSKKESKTTPLVSSPPSFKREPSDLSKKDSKIPVLKREPSDLLKKESPSPSVAIPKDMPEMKREPSDLSKKDSKIPIFKREPSDLSDKKLSKEETKVSVSSSEQVEKIELKKEIQVSISSSGAEKSETIKEQTVVEIKQEIPLIEEKGTELLKKDSKTEVPSSPPEKLGLKREPSDLSKKESKIPVFKREPSDLSDKELSTKDPKSPLLKREPSDLSKKDAKTSVVPTVKETAGLQRETEDLSKKESSVIIAASPVVPAPQEIPGIKREPSDLSKKDSKIPVLKREPSDLTKKESPAPSVTSPKEMPGMKREPSDLSKKDSKIPVFKREPSDLSKKESTTPGAASPKEMMPELKREPSDLSKKDSKIPLLKREPSDLTKKESTTSSSPSSPKAMPGFKREPSDLTKKDTKIPVLKREPSDLTKKESASGPSSPKEIFGLKREPSDLTKKDTKIPVLKREPSDLVKKESASGPSSPKQVFGIKREPSDLTKKDTKIPVLKREPSDLTKKGSSSGPSSPKEIFGLKREPSDLTKKDTKIPVLKRELSDLTKKESPSGPSSPKEIVGLKREPSDLTKRDTKIPVLKREPSDLVKKESASGSSSPKEIFGLKREPSDLTKKDTKIPVLKREASDLTKKELSSGPSSPKEITGLKREPSDLSRKDTKIPVLKREPSDLAKKESTSGPSSPKDIRGFKREPSDLSKKESKIPTFKRESSDLSKKDSKIPSLKREPSDLSKKDSKIPSMKREGSDLSKKDSKIPSLKREPSDLSKKDSKIPSMKREGSDLSKKDSKIPTFKREPSDLTKKDSKISSLKREGSDLTKKDSKIPSMKREPSDLSKKDSKIPVLKREASDLSDKDSSSKESKIPSRRESLTKSDKDKQIKQKVESKIPKMKFGESGPSKSLDKSGKSETLTTKVTEKVSEYVETRMSEIKSQSQTITKTFTDPVEALKEFEAMEKLLDAAPGVVTSKTDHTESKTLEKKEQKLSEISKGDDKMLKFEEKDQILKEKSSESTSTVQTDDVTLEDKFSTSKKTDKNEVQNISVLVSGDKQFIDASATQSMSLIKDEARTQSRDNEDGILVQETGSSLLKDRKIDTALSMEKDSLNLTEKKDIDMFDLGKSLQDELKAAVVGEQSHEESSERNETKIFPSRETSSQEYSETLEEHQRRTLGEHEARNIAENLVQQIEEEIVKRSESTDGLSQTLIIGKSSVEKINDKVNIEAEDFDEQLADDLAEKFGNIMGKRKESQAQVIESVEQIRMSLLGNKDLSENSNRESLSISDDLTKDEESFPSSSPLGSERQDVPSKFQVEISRDASLAELTKDKISPIRFEAYESTGARVLEIIEPQGNLSTRQDSIDVSSIEIDDPKHFRDDDDDEDLSLGDRYLREGEFGRLHESPAMSSLDKIGQDRDLTFSPSTMSESSLVHDLRSLSPTIQSSKTLPELAESDDAGFSSMEPEKTPEKLANLNTQIIDKNIIPSIVSPKIKVAELEIKTVDWSIGNEKIAINENIEPSLAFDKELDDYQSSIIMQQSMTSSHDESATRSSEDISTIDSVKESDHYNTAGKTTNIINIIPPSESEIEHEMVEDRLDISCQELVAALQREHEAKTPTDEKIPVTPRKLSESDSELELVEQSLENVKKVQILPSSFDEKLTEVSEMIFDPPKNLSYMQDLTSIPTIEETLEKPIKEKSEKEEKEIDTKDDKMKTDDDLLSNEKERVSSPLKLKKEDLQSVDLSLRYANTVLDQVVQKEIAEVKESLEAAKQDLIEELSENSDKIIQIKDSPSEFQFKLQPETIPNDLPFLYKAPSLEHDQGLSQSSLTDSPIAKPRKTKTETVKTQDDSFDDNEEDGEAEEEDYEEDEEENDYEESEKSSKIIDNKSLPVPASRSSSDPEKDKESSSSLSVPPKPAPRRRHKPSRGGKKLNIEAEGGGSSSESSNYQSCDYEIGSGSRPSSSDIEALHSAAGVLSCTASEYETALMSIDHSTASRPTSQDYQSALSTLSSRESMKSLNSFSSGRLGSIDSTSEHTDTLVASEPEMENDEIDVNLELALENDEEIPLDGSFDKSTDGLPRTMKRSSEMIFEQISEDSGSLPGPLGESMEDDSRGQSTKVPSSIIISEDDDQKTSTIDVTSETGKALDSSSTEVKFKPIEAQSTGDDIDASELKMSSLSTVEDTDALLLTKRSVLQQASMSTSSTSGMSIETIVEREKLDRNSPDSDSFELVDKPDIIDDFVVIEEVGKEAEEFDSEGKSISIRTIPTSSMKKYDRDLENLIGDKKDGEEKILQNKLSRNNDLFDFESEESPPQISNDEQYSQSLSDDETDHKKWMEMQFQDQRNYELEYDRGPLEDIKEEEITDFEAGSSRFGSLGSHKGSIGSSGSMKGSYGNDYDVLAGRKQFSKSVEHDNISMNSLQEFESIEYSVAADNLRKLQHCGSQDSVNNGSLPRRYITSRSGHGGSDDVVSVSSLKDFEGLEQACREAHMIELRAKEEEDLLDHESPENRYRLENLTKSKIISDTISTNITTTFNPSTSGSDDYEKRIMEIDEIIRIAQANVEKFDRQDDTTEDISQIIDIDKIEPPSNITLPLESDDSLIKTRDFNAMETSTDSLEIEANDDKKNLMCRSSDSLELKTTLDFPSLSYSDSLNNVKDAKEGQCSGEQFNSARRISSDSLEMPILGESGNDDGSNRQTKSASSTEVAVKKNGKTVYSHTTDA